MLTKVWTGTTPLRASAILTNAYVATATKSTEDLSQIVLYVSFTIGSLTRADMKIEFSNDDSNWYQEVSLASVGSGAFTTNQLVRRFSASGNYRIALEALDKYIRVSCIGVGTLTNSLMSVELQV